MRNIVKLFWLLVLFVQSLFAYALPAQVESLNFASNNAGRLVFALDSSPHYRYFTLSNPSRLVVDFQNTMLTKPIGQPPVDHNLAVGVRTAVRNKSDLRVVVELNAEAKPLVVEINKGASLQLQFDLTAMPSQASVAQPVKKSDPKPKQTRQENTSISSVKPVLKPIKAAKKAVSAKGRDILIAIDAGHGGKDKGAQGANGTQEKDVVLAIAKRLQSSVNRQPGMKAVMIRDGDYFVKLRQRVKLAQDAKADLFVSIHADAFEDSSAHGASVYTLANKGASSQLAQYLANSENSSDLAGGTGSDIQDETLASVLMDLTDKAAKEASQHIGSKVLKSVKGVGHLHRNSVQKAGFVVLKSPIPSILVETAFISNPEEERRLNSRAYQDKMAAAVFSGIISHFKQYAPANTLFAQLQKSGKTVTKVAARSKSSKTILAKSEVDKTGKSESTTSSQTKHVISHGETLSGIARQYGVSMREIRNINELEDVNVKTGQILQIPRSS